ncbi:MAG: DUF3168 domain-containing protein [Acidobacteriota bacterium]|nr:DUF3168 domain-containing protein [Acidobacteriota bacterium]
MLTNGVVAYLLAQEPVTSIVNQSIQPIPSPEDLSQYPLITYQSPSDVSDNANDGPVGVATSRIVFDCKALRYLDARNLALAVKAALNGYSGTLPNGTVVFLAQSVNLVDRWEDGSRISCTAVHVLFQYKDC